MAIAGSGRHDEMAKRKELFEVLPRGDVAERIDTKDEVVRIPALTFVCEITEGIDRVRNSRPSDLHSGNGKTGIFCHR